MFLNNFDGFHSVMGILLIIVVNDCFGKISYARIDDGSDQTQCFNNLLFDLPNKSFSATSVWQNKPEFEAHQARMSSMIDSSSEHNGQAWCTNEFVSGERSEWLEIDLGDLKVISSFFTMGRGDGNFKEFMSFFYLDYQRQGHWIQYNHTRLFVANGDSRNVARTQFNIPIVARKIRIYPISKESSTRACLRISIYGCKFDDGVVEYSVPQGHKYSVYDDEKYDFQDLTYDGSRLPSSSTHGTILRGGLGQLMDNIVFDGIDEIDRTNRFRFVGWNRKVLRRNEIEFKFKFDQIRKTKGIRIYSLNMASKNIGYFSSASVHFSIGGQIYDAGSQPYLYQTMVERHTIGSHWIDIPIQGVTTRHVKLRLFFELDWIVLSEIIILSEKSDIFLPTETPASSQIFTTTTNYRNISTEQPQQPQIFTVSRIPSKRTITTSLNKIHEASFIDNSSFGFLITIASGFFGFLLLIMIIIVVFTSIRRRHKRSKDKSRYSNYTMRTTGGPFMTDSLIAPLTNGTHSSSGAGSYHYNRNGSKDLGLNYPVMGKEYMTLSSKSGTDYDMAGGNSLDGLIPRDARFSRLSSHFIPYNLGDNQYPISTNSRQSNDESMGSSFTEYATTSLYHFNPTLDLGRTTAPSSLANNNFRLQAISPNHVNFSRVSPNMQSPIGSTQIFRQNRLMEIFPNYSPNMHCSPVNINLLPTLHFQPENSFNPSHSLAKLKGICGNSLMISIHPNSQYFSSTSLPDILSNLSEINPSEIENLSVIGQGEYGNISFIRTVQQEMPDINRGLMSTMYLSKSVVQYATKDIRNEIVREMSVLRNIKHNSFLQLTSFAFDQQNGNRTKLCFLFKIDKPMENLYSFLRHNYVTNPGTPKIENTAHKPSLQQSINLVASHLYPSNPTLLFICSQISRGMSHLESLQIVHRDLAARNCLICQDMTVKIVDIAMSMDHFKDHYSECVTRDLQSDDRSQVGTQKSVVKQNFPLQWMAHESILRGIYSVKTDIWSFGVTMWEIVTRCHQAPYGEFSIPTENLIENCYSLSTGNADAIYPNGTIPMRHHRYQNQSNKPPVILDIMHDINPDLNVDLSKLLIECWHSNPLQRPGFDNISSFLEHMIAKTDFRLLNITL